MYKLCITSHRIIGHAYIPICKFQLITTPVVNGRQISEQSQYINPPLIGSSSRGDTPVNDVGKGGVTGSNIRSKGKQVTSSESLNNNNNNSVYIRQFPINFSTIVMKQDDSIQIRLIELTKNGRQKQIGFSRMIINYQVINKTTKHKIIKVQTANEVLSVIEIFVQLISNNNKLIENIKNTSLLLNNNNNTTTTSNNNNSSINHQYKQQPNTALKTQLLSYTLQEQDQDDDQQQQSSSSIDENAKFDYNGADQSGYMYNQVGKNDDLSYVNMGMGVNNNKQRVIERNQYMFNSSNVNNNNFNNNNNKTSNSFTNNRYSNNNMKTENSDSPSKVSGKIYKQQFQNNNNNNYNTKNNNTNNNNSNVNLNNNNNNVFLSKNRKNNTQQYLRRETIGQRDNHYNQNKVIINKDQSYGHNRSSNNHHSRRYLVKYQQQKHYSDQYHQQLHQQSYQQDPRVKSFSGNNNNNTNNKNTQFLSANPKHIQSVVLKSRQQLRNMNNNNIHNSRTKRRLKYIFSNNQLKYVSVVNGNVSVDDGRVNKNRGVSEDKTSSINKQYQDQQSHVIRVHSNAHSQRKNHHNNNSNNNNSTTLKHQPSQQHNNNNNTNNNYNIQQTIKNSTLNNNNSTPTRQHPIFINKHNNNPNLSNQLSSSSTNNQPLQYFITHHQTNPGGCYILSNLFIVYEIGQNVNQLINTKNKNNSSNNKLSSSSPSSQYFKPKYITFLTYNLYEKVVRVNCLSPLFTNNINNNKVRYLDAKQVSNFILKSQHGDIKPSAVCDKYSQLEILLPKYCLIFRIQIIMEDESIFIGTLANQLGSNIKSTLHLKKSLNYNNNNSNSNKQTSQQQHFFQSINLIIDVNDMNSLYEQNGKRHVFDDRNINDIDDSLQNVNVSLKKGANYHDLGEGSKEFIKSKNSNSNNNKRLDQNKSHVQQNKSISQSPSRRKQVRQQSTIEYLPNINLADQLNQNQSQRKLLISPTHNNNQHPKYRQLSPVQKTLNAITAYKICLSPMTGPVNQVNKNQFNKNSVQYKTGQNYHVNFQAFTNQNKKRQNRNHILMQQEEQQNLKCQKQNDDQKSAQQSDIQYLMRRDFQEIKMPSTLSKDLPKIMIHRSNIKPLNMKKQVMKNIKENIQMINKRYKSTSEDQLLYKNQVRLEFFRKILGNKFTPKQHKNSSIESMQKHNKNHSKHSHSKSKIFLNQKRNDIENKRYKKLTSLPYYDLSSTKMFSSDPKNKYQKHSKLSVSPNKHTKKNTYARQLKCLKNHMMSNSSLLTHKGRQQIQQKNLATYRISIRKIDFLKLIDPKQRRSIKRHKKYGSDNENSQLSRNQSFVQDSQSCEVFLKLFNESKRKKQFVTTSKVLQQATNNQKSYDHQQKSPLNLEYTSCSWILSDRQFLFKKIKLQDLITIQAYGDLASVDNHQFLGKCIFSVQEMLYMKHQKKITGYLVKQKAIESHVTVHFQIDEEDN